MKNKTNLKDYYNLKKGNYNSWIFTNPRKLKVNRKRTTIKGKGMLRKSYNQSMVASWIEMGVKVTYVKSKNIETTFNHANL